MDVTNSQIIVAAEKREKCVKIIQKYPKSYSKVPKKKYSKIPIMRPHAPLIRS